MKAVSKGETYRVAKGNAMILKKKLHTRETEQKALTRKLLVPQ